MIMLGRAKNVLNDVSVSLKHGQVTCLMNLQLVWIASLTPRVLWELRSIRMMRENVVPCLTTGIAQLVRSNANDVAIFQMELSLNMRPIALDMMITPWNATHTPQ